MERLTQNNFDYCLEMCEPECMHECPFYKDDQESKCHTAAMYDRLAAYEETNWSPDDIREAFSLIRYASDLVNGNISYNHLREILAADQEGRLVVLPCKVGDTVYRVWPYRKPIITEHKMHDLTEIAKYIDAFGVTFGKTVFLTRSEAEAAMKGVSEDA